MEAVHELLADDVGTDHLDLPPNLSTKADRAIAALVREVVADLVAHSETCYALRGLIERGNDVQRWLREACGVDGDIVVPAPFGVADGPGIEAFGPDGRRIVRAFASALYARQQFFKTDPFDPGMADTSFAKATAKVFAYSLCGYQRPCGTSSHYRIGRVFDRYPDLVFKSDGFACALGSETEFHGGDQTGKPVFVESEDSEEEPPSFPALLVYGYEYVEGPDGEGAKGSVGETHVYDISDADLGLDASGRPVEVDDCGPFWELFSSRIERLPSIYVEI